MHDAHAPHQLFDADQARLAAAVVDALLRWDECVSLRGGADAKLATALDLAEFELSARGVRCVRVRKPASGQCDSRNLIAQIISHARSDAAPAALTDEDLKAAFAVLANPGGDDSRVALLVSDADALAPSAWRTIQLACRASSQLRLVLAGRPDFSDAIAADSFSDLRHRITRKLDVAPPAAEPVAPRQHRPSVPPPPRPSAARRLGFSWPFARIGLVAALALLIGFMVWRHLPGASEPIKQPRLQARGNQGASTDALLAADSPGAPPVAAEEEAASATSPGAPAQLAATNQPLGPAPAPSVAPAVPDDLAPPPNASLPISKGSPSAPEAAPSQAPMQTPSVAPSPPAAAGPLPNVPASEAPSIAAASASDASEPQPIALAPNPAAAAGGAVSTPVVAQPPPGTADDEATKAAAAALAALFLRPASSLEAALAPAAPQPTPYLAALIATSFTPTKTPSSPFPKQTADEPARPEAGPERGPDARAEAQVAAPSLAQPVAAPESPLEALPKSLPKSLPEPAQGASVDAAPARPSPAAAAEPGAKLSLPQGGPQPNPPKPPSASMPQSRRATFSSPAPSERPMNQQRCRDITVRTQLGRALSAEDLEFLRRGCRSG